MIEQILDEAAPKPDSEILLKTEHFGQRTWCEPDQGLTVMARTIQHQDPMISTSLCFLKQGNALAF